MTLDEKLDKYMKENNIHDLKQLASKINIPYTTLRDIYLRKSAENSRFSTIKKIANYIDCTFDYIAYDDVIDKKGLK